MFDSYQLAEITIKQLFTEQGVECYKCCHQNLINEYFILSEEKSQHLLISPEVVGYDVYLSLIPSTSQMLGYLKTENKITKANILSILRGSLNYPLEESCHHENIQVHAISFLSSERIFTEDQISGLEIKYSKLAAIPNSTLLVGDIIASGDTLIKCLAYVINEYRKSNLQLRNIIIFTIGGTKAIELLEQMTQDIRSYWTQFEGFTCIFYEGIFSCYQDKGVSGMNIPNVDFHWKGGIISPEFRKQVLSMQNPLFEKCIIYDGGARRFEIKDHIHEVLEFWEEMLNRADQIDLKTLLEEKLGTSIETAYEDWIQQNHYTCLSDHVQRMLFQQEREYANNVLNKATLRSIAEQRISEFKSAMKDFF